MNHNIEQWLWEQDFAGAQAFPDAMGNQMPTPPGGEINAANPPSPTMPGPDPSAPNPNTPPELPDVANDPQAPDMPEERDEEDFEQWKNNYFKESIKGDVSKCMDMVLKVRNWNLEDPYQEKFVEDNLQICFLRQNSNIDKASSEIRKLIRQELDQNNPSVSVVNHVNNVLGTMPELNNIFLKLKGTFGMKGDLHRKFIASLLGAVQVGSGANTEDVIFNDRDYSIRISTRFNSQWGRVDLGKWSLREDDPERYLTEPEQKRLEEGSPEEKEVLRRRVVMESIAESFKTRAFIVNVVGKDGTIYTLGWDLAGSLRAAYTDGKLVVRTNLSDNSEAMINDDGAIIPFVDLKIKYSKDTGEVDSEGKPDKEEHDFLERIDGMLFLTAQLNILKEASSSFQGIVLKETPYTGNPADIKNIIRCVPSSQEILLRSCG